LEKCLAAFGEPVCLHTPYNSETPLLEYIRQKVVLISTEHTEECIPNITKLETIQMPIDKIGKSTMAYSLKKSTKLK
jgi:hypothetical protein